MTIRMRWHCGAYGLPSSRHDSEAIDEQHGQSTLSHHADTYSPLTAGTRSPPSPT